MNVPPAIMSRIYTFITLAFGRHVLLNQMPVKKPSTFHRVLLSGEVELDVPLMSQPTFARSLILAQELADDGYHEILEQLALRSAEVGVLNDLLHKGSKLQHAQILPIVVPTKVCRKNRHSKRSGRSMANNFGDRKRPNPGGSSGDPCQHPLV